MASSTSLLSLPFPATSPHRPKFPAISKPLSLSFPNAEALNPSLPLRRRIFLTSASAIWDAFTGGGNAARDAALAIRRGMQLFKKGDVGESLVEFDRAIELDPRQKIFGREGCLSTIWIDLKKGQSSSGWMLQPTQMTLKSLYGAFYVKLKCMGLKKLGSVSWRLVETHGLSCVKPILCLGMLGTQKSLFQHFQVVRSMNTSMHLYMLVFITNPRMKWT
ncbi:uncharacterized protein [Typha angustifolia]|uniref:uncharacterized protein isoform X4 n=1 Tax=Typha angustifolia TaxID=59011 RepID=UPI003C2CF6C1